MNKHAGTIVKSAALMAVVAALVATRHHSRMRRKPQPMNLVLAVPGAHYELVDSQGNVVGELVSEARPASPAGSRRHDGPTHAAAGGPTSRRRDVHPDHGKALSVGQMSAAWQAELDRVFPQPVTGGG